MNVFKKLQDARVKLHNTQLHKSGKNNFAKFNYFELADFIPTVTKIFNELGLCGVVSFTGDTAYLTVYNVDGEKDDFVTFTSPLVMASMDRVQPIQSLGATHTYLRRYLWLMAMEIVENDVVDAAEPAESPSLKMPFKAAKVETPKVETPKAAVIPTAKTAIDMNDGEWTIKSDNVVANLPAVILAANTLLDIAKTEDDLLVIFQKNRKVFDEIQAASPKDYEEIINNFAATKEKLKK
jgi:hypothetical protein